MVRSGLSAISNDLTLAALMSLAMADPWMSVHDHTLPGMSLFDSSLVPENSRSALAFSLVACPTGSGRL